MTNSKTRQLSDSELLGLLGKGVPGTSMPSFSYLGAQSLRAVLKHLRALQGKVASLVVPGNPHRGRELFYGGAECSRCHMVRGAGGFFASDLTGYAEGRSAEAVRDAIVSPNRDLDPRKRAIIATTLDGKKLEGILRNEDNFSVQLQTSDGVFHLFSKSDLTSLERRPESPMPSNYGQQLTAANLDDLVSFLRSVAAENPKPKKAKERDDD